MLRLNDVTLGYDSGFQLFIDQIHLKPGNICFLFGRNGCGKSTLLRGLAGLLKFNPKDMQIPNRISYLPPRPWADGKLTARDLFEILTKQNWEQKNTNLKTFDVLQFEDTRLLNLSSGELQRVWLSCVLSQHSDLMLFDEPLHYLDWVYQEKLFKLISEEKTRTFIIANHDFNWSIRFHSSSMISIESGKSTFYPSTLESISNGALDSVFGFKSQIIKNPMTGEPLLTTSHESTKM